jgi:ABC-type dipeptide/oligopeptide/nickel transport system permease subunit
MDRKSVRHVGWALAVIAATLALGHFLLDTWPTVGPVDEFGRNNLGATLVSVANSMAAAFWMTCVALATPVIVAYFAAVTRSILLERLVHGLTRTLDVIPVFLWVAISYVSLGSSGIPLKLVAIALIAFPYVLGLCLPRFEQIASAPFSLNAKAARTPMRIRIWQHFLPNALPVLAYPFAVIFGLCVTFDAALGLLGMSARNELSLGMLLLRAKERAPIDETLDWYAVGALAICLLIFWFLRSLLDTGNRTQSSDDGGSA